MLKKYQVKVLQEHYSLRELAKMYGVSYQTINNWLKKYKVKKVTPEKKQTELTCARCKRKFYAMIKKDRKYCPWCVVKGVYK